MHNFLNFESLDVFLDFLEILRCPLSNPFGLISIWYSMFMYESLTKKVVFVDFSKWPIMSKFLTSCECIFWTWEMNMNCRELKPLQNEMRLKGLLRGHLKLSKKSKNTSKDSKLRKLCIGEVDPFCKIAKSQLCLKLQFLPNGPNLFHLFWVGNIVHEL